MTLGVGRDEGTQLHLQGVFRKNKETNNSFNGARRSGGTQQHCILGRASVFNIYRMGRILTFRRWKGFTAWMKVPAFHQRGFARSASTRLDTI
jgi:RimJ/RimL family protein N-acetyltransferase